MVPCLKSTKRESRESRLEENIMVLFFPDIQDDVPMVCMKGSLKGYNLAFRDCLEGRSRSKPDKMLVIELAL